MFLLFLTLYPYLFNYNICCRVAAYSAEDVDLKHNSISKFDIIESGDIIWSRWMMKRHSNDDGGGYAIDELGALLGGKQSDGQPSTKVIHFSSLGKKFNLILDKPSHLITDDFTVVSLDRDSKETLIKYDTNDLTIMDGYVQGEEKSSSATASFNKKDHLLTAQIKTGQDIIIVEPTYLHKDNLFISSTPTTNLSDKSNQQLNSKLSADTMIVYNLKDHRQFQYDNDTKKLMFNPEELCDSVKVSNKLFNSSKDMNYQKQNTNEHDVFKYYSKKRQLKRSIKFSTNDQYTIKEKTRCTLHLVADYLFYKHVGKGDLQTTINYLLALINRVNQIYLPTLFEIGDGTGDSSEYVSNIGFTVQNITIHQEYTRLSSNNDPHYNMQTNETWRARQFLDNFSKYSPSKHYCLAHLLTYRQFDSLILGLAYVGSPRHGSIGGICSPTQQKGDSYYKHNTGISTSKGINGETLITRQADLVVAHELGHNLGSDHDSSECRPPPSKGGAYLMHPFAVMGFEKNNRFLSNCSRLSIGRVIKNKAATCFVVVIDHVCGNGIVEDDEECDGGDVGYGHNDPCCDSSCRLTPGSQCSDRHSWCCSKCHIRPAGQHCRQAEEHNCRQAAYCDGSSPECPVAPPVEDNSICVGRGLCKSGECTPFCEAKGLVSCLCNTSRDACKLCCKSLDLNSTCAPYDRNSPYLPDGLLCYKGVCEKGRCEQPIQDAVERLWDVLEDINFTTFVKFLRDNIILVILVVSIPVWCIFSHFIDEFDKRVKDDVMQAIIRHNKRRRNPTNHSPFLPRLFVGDDGLSSQSVPENDMMINTGNNKQPMLIKPPHVGHNLNGDGDFNHPTAVSNQPGSRPPNYGFHIPNAEREEVVFEPMSSIPLNDMDQQNSPVRVTRYNDQPQNGYN